MKIVNMERDAATGFVNVVHWVISDTDGEYTGSVYGSIGLEGELVTPFEQLTEAQVIGWVEEAMGAETLQAHKDAVAAQIAEAKAPKVATGMPWVSVAKQEVKQNNVGQPITIAVNMDCPVELLDPTGTARGDLTQWDYDAATLTFTPDVAGTWTVLTWDTPDGTRETVDVV